MDRRWKEPGGPEVDSRKLRTLLKILKLMRILVVLVPQYGYIQPDEFHQFTEPLASKFMSVEGLKTWEFSRKQPLRSMLLPQLVCGHFFWLLRFLYQQNDYRAVTSFLVLVVPRLIMVSLTFLIDHVLEYSPLTGRKTSKLPLYWSLIHSSTYLAFTYYNRTFTNTLETILLALLIYVIFDCLVNQQRLLTHLKIGAILAAGFFNRPTFAVFAAIPVLYWILAFKRQNGTIYNAIYNVFAVFRCFLFISFLFILADTYYYRGIDIFTKMFQNPYSLFSAALITPLNFITYNIQQKNLANHGLHPFYFHALVCFPLMFTLMAFVAYFDWIRFLAKLAMNRNRKQMLLQLFRDLYYAPYQDQFPAVLFLTILVSLIGLSAIPHHEPRFLMPLVVPMVFLFGHRLLRSISYPNTIVWLWIITQLILAIFYGFIHQAGIVNAMVWLRQHHQDAIMARNIPTNITRSTELIFSRMYLPPRHLLLIPEMRFKSHHPLEIHDYSIEPLVPSMASTFRKSLDDFVIRNSEQLDGTPNRKGDTKHQIRMYIVVPSCYDEMLKVILDESVRPYHPYITFENLHVHQLTVRYPNFSAEDLEPCLSLLVNGQEPQIPPEESADGQHEDLSRRYNLTYLTGKVPIVMAEPEQSWWQRAVRTIGITVWMVELR